MAHGGVDGWEEEGEVGRNIGLDRHKKEPSCSTRLLRQIFPSPLGGEAGVEEDGREAGLVEPTGEHSHNPERPSSQVQSPLWVPSFTR